MELLNIYDPHEIESKPFALYQEWTAYITQKAELNNNEAQPTNLLVGGQDSLLKGLTS